MRQTLSILWAVVLIASSGWSQAAEPLKVGAFSVDVTPPIGAPLCDSLVTPAKEIVDPLSARGVVILSAGQPIVLCAVDWVGIGNGGYDAWRKALAKAAGTTESRVAVHCLHQHDAPGCDLDAEELLASRGLSGAVFHVAFAREAIRRAAEGVKQAAAKAQPVTHVGFGVGRAEQVASNRRVLGPDGKVKYVRYSATKDEAIRAAAEGVIDPDVRLLAFFNGERPLVSITYYATHPQSYYGSGGVSCDFPGLARGLREKALPEIAHIHFNGASGNVTAGKYNDGSPPLRGMLAERLAAGMQKTWENVKKTPVTAADVDWRTVSVALPPSPGLDEQALLKVVDDSAAKPVDRVRAARNLAWLNRTERGDKIELSCLKIGPGYVLHMPGELFIEYQLAAQKMRPDAPVLMAAYGDYGPGYIGTAIAYTQGGYETGPVSRVAPEVEEVLMRGMKELLK